MRKRLLALVLALGVCLGMALPASAANTTSLDMITQQAYYDVLTSEIHKYGTVSSTGDSGVEYVALEDMDGNGVLDLIMIRYSNEPQSPAYINVWTIQNGKAVQTVNEEIYPGGAYTEASIFLAHKDGQIAVCDSFEWNARYYDLSGSEDLLTFNIHYVDGTTETIHTNDAAEVSELQASFGSSWTMAEVQFSGGAGTWLHNENAAQTVNQIQTLLTAKNTVASSVNADSSFTISGTDAMGNPYTISFDSALVEEKSVQIRSGYWSEGEYSYDPYDRLSVVLVALRSNSKISIPTGNREAMPGKTVVLASYLEDDGNNRYTQFDSGAVEFLAAGSAGEQLLTLDGKSQIARIYGASDGKTYLIFIDDGTAAVGGFTDVKSDAYYADAVEWAVDEGITSGTTASTFSPNNTCTTAQILTFLWRANGSPAVSGGNPFTDVSTGAYYYQAALWAREKGLISGSAFNGDTPCTRADTVTYLWKLAGQPSAGASGFTDVPSSASYAQAVAWAVREGITSGTSASTFSPDNTCTRAQIVTFLYRDMA